MNAIQARKNLETDNPKFDKEGFVWCKVLVNHIKAEYLNEYELRPGERFTFAHKAIPMDRVRRADTYFAALIESEEAYDLYLEGYVVPHPSYIDPRPRAALLPYLTPKQKEAQAYLDGENSKSSIHRNDLPGFIEDKAYELASKLTDTNRSEVKAKALRGE